MPDFTPERIAELRKEAEHAGTTVTMYSFTFLALLDELEAKGRALEQATSQILTEIHDGERLVRWYPGTQPETVAPDLVAFLKEQAK